MFYITKEFLESTLSKDPDLEKGRYEVPLHTYTEDQLRSMKRAIEQALEVKTDF